MKDIFIDTNQIQFFTNPAEGEYRDLMNWLMTNNANENPNDNAYLLMSDFLRMEYIQTLSEATRASLTIHSLIKLLINEGRLNKFEKEAIKEFQEKHYTKKNLKKLKPMGKDANHLPIVLLSQRKLALTSDKGFQHNILNFPKIQGTVSDKPSDLNYQ